MPIEFSPNLTKRIHTWSAWKQLQHTATGIYQHAEDDNQYRIWYYDGPEVHLCVIWKIPVPDDIVDGGYTQAQNDADKTDWEANYKISSNWPLEQRARDGRVVVRVSTAVPGRRYRIRALYFKTADDSSLVNKESIDGADFNDVTVKCYDSLGNQVTGADLANATRTVVDFEEQDTLEIIGGWLIVDSTIANGTTDAWWVSVIGAPDIPEAYGGSLVFVSQANLELLGNSKITMDGRASAEMKYDSIYHSSKLRFVFAHPAGGSKRMQLFLETFR